MIIVGIDNGLDGGLAAISCHNGDLIDRIKMPTKKVVGGIFVVLPLIKLCQKPMKSNLST